MNPAHFWRVEELWPRSTIAILGGGPSLAAAQVEQLRGRVKVIAINDGYRLAPWADLLYFCDNKWFRWHAAKPEFKAFAGIKVTLENPDVVAKDVTIRSIRNYGFNPGIPGQNGLCTLRDGVFSGRNSGYQALNLAVHLGAARILLLGYDMRAHGGRTHWFGEHPDRTQPPYTEMLRAFPTLIAPLKKRGVEVINCTPGSALGCFPRADLEGVLPDPKPAALPA